MLRNEEIVGMVTILAVTCHPDCFLSENLEIWARSIQPTESNGRHLKNIFIMKALLGFPGGSDGKESACSAGDPAVIPGLGRFPWRSRLPTPVFLPGKSHEQRILVGYSRWGHKELDTTEWLSPPPPHTHSKARDITIIFFITIIFDSSGFDMLLLLLLGRFSRVRLCATP